MKKDEFLQHPTYGSTPNNKTEIRRAKIEDVPVIGTLAGTIWPDCYGNIISEAQINYMLNLFYADDALIDQIRIKKHRFLLLETDGIPSGFASFSEKIPNDHSIYRLHKIYLLPKLQGLGLGKKLLLEVEKQATESGALQLELNVNRNNPAIAFYIRNGFEILHEEDIDIGNGFFMNDYVMRKKTITKPIDGFA